MKKTKEEVISTLEQLLDIIWIRSNNQEILTTELWKSNGSEFKTIFDETGAGNAYYKLILFLKAGILKITKVNSPNQVYVEWANPAIKPNYALAADFREIKMRAKNEPEYMDDVIEEYEKLIGSYVKFRGNRKEKNETQTPEIQNNDETQTSTIQNNDELCKWGAGTVTSFILDNDLLPEYIEYSPYGDTIPRIRKGLRIMEANSRQGYCTKNQIFKREMIDDDGNTVMIDVRDFNTKLTKGQLLHMEVLVTNPENEKEVRTVEYPKNFDSFSKQIAFYIYYQKNSDSIEKRKAERLAKQRKNIHEILLKEKENIIPQKQHEVNELLNVSDSETQESLLAYDKLVNEHNEIRKTIRKGYEDVQKGNEMVQKNLKRTAELLEKLHAIITMTNDK
jgi:hypothetical protein